MIFLVDKDNSVDATHNEYDYDPIKQAKSDLKKKTQPIPDIAEMDFKFDEKVDYRQQRTSTLRIWKVCLHSNMYA
jgi:hypothetical protein